MTLRDPAGSWSSILVSFFRWTNFPFREQLKLIIPIVSGLIGPAQHYLTPWLDRELGQHQPVDSVKMDTLDRDSYTDPNLFVRIQYVLQLLKIIQKVHHRTDACLSITDDTGRYGLLVMAEPLPLLYPNEIAPLTWSLHSESRR